MEGKKHQMLAFIVGATIAVTNGARLTSRTAAGNDYDRSALN